MYPIMLELIIYLRYNSHIWNNMDVVLSYRTARKDMTTRTEEKVSKDEEADKVSEDQEYGIECEDQDGPLTTNDMQLFISIG